MHSYVINLIEALNNEDVETVLDCSEVSCIDGDGQNSFIDVKSYKPTKKSIASFAAQDTLPSTNKDTIRMNSGLESCASPKFSSAIGNLKNLDKGFVLNSYDE